MKPKNYSAARIRSASFNEQANTIDIVWSTGADVLREDEFGTQYIERLSMQPSAVRLDRLNSGAPMLDTHSSDSLSNVIGSVVPGSAEIEDGKGIATVKLSSAASDSDVVRKIAEGVIRNISVGYLIHHQTRQESADDGPDVFLVDDWEPLEASAVPIPADPGAQIRSADSKRPRDRQTPMQRAAAYTRTLLNNPVALSREQAHGAAEMRRSLAGGNAGGEFRAERAQTTGLDRRAYEKGAAEARALLRKGRK
jgi:HK97 family phage prohead protease